MLAKSGMRFNRIDDDEGVKQKKKYEENLKQKKESLKQEFEQLEEIRKMDDLSVKSLNLIKFKNELDRVQNINKSKKSTFNQLQKLYDELNRKKMNESQQMSISQNKFTRSNINNHHSDPLFSTFSKNLTSKKLDPEDLKLYSVELDEQEERYDQLISEEEERSQSLQLVLEQTQKQKLFLTKEIEEMKLLNRISNSRFSNIEAISFLATEKNTASRKNLKEIKQELNEMDHIRVEHRKAQTQKQRDCQKEIYVGEEYVSHNSMKIEELSQKNRELENQIEMLNMEEIQILKKRQKSRYITKYIDCFEQFELIFMNPISEYQGDRLVDQFEVNEKLLYEANIYRNEITVEIDDSELVSSDELDRNQLLNVINSFFSEDELRAEKIVEFMIAEFWQLKTDVNKNNLAYETLLREKTHFQHILEEFQQQLEELFLKNEYLQELDIVGIKKHDEVRKLEEIIDQSDQVAFDTGLFVSNINHKGTVTLNIIKQEISNTDETLTLKTQQAQNLLFNFLLSIAELMERSYKILQLISQQSLNMTSIDIEQQITTIERFLENLWYKRNRPRGSSKKNQATKAVFTNFLSNVRDIHDDNSQEIHLNQSQIQSVFREVFFGEADPNRKVGKDYLDLVIYEASRYLYVQCKQDQLMWFFLDINNLREFLIQLKQDNKEYFKVQNINQLTVNILVPAYQISVLRQQLVGIFSSIFQQLLQFYKNLQVKLRDLSGELKIYLKEKDPKFDSGRLQFIPVKEGFAIKEAREKISKKMEFYKTGEVVSKKLDPPSTINKIFSAPGSNKESIEATEKILIRGLVKIVEPPIHAQQEMFLVENNANKDQKISEDQLQTIKSYFRGQLHHKIEPHIALQKQKEEIKENMKKSRVSEKDDFDEERDKIKDDMFQEWEHVQEAKAEKVKVPQTFESAQEKKNQIKEATERLYGDVGETAQTLKSMSVTTGILSDIDRLEKQPSSIEQGFLISNFRLQKKSLNRNLNNEVTLPSLNFLKPNSAYFQRRQQSQEQRRVMQQKKYDLIESGMAPNTANNQSRPQTEQLHYQRPNNEKSKGVAQQQQMKVEKYYARYGSQANSEKFLGYLMRQKSESPEKFFQGHQQERNMELRAGTSSGGARPKSILVEPSY